MVEERREERRINEEEAVKAFVKFRSFSADKQACAIAFMNGMEFQKSISKVGNPLAKEM